MTALFPRHWILIFCGLFCTGISVASQSRLESGAAAPTSVESSAGVRGDVARLVVLLEEIRDQQRVDLLIKRIDLEVTRQAPLEAELRKARKQAGALRAELDALEVLEREVHEALEQESLGGIDTLDGPSHNMRAELDEHAQQLNDQLEEAELRVRRLEDDLAVGRDKIEELDDMLRKLTD